MARSGIVRSEPAQFLRQMLVPHHRTIAFIAALSLVGGLAEAAVLVLVVDAAVELSGGATSTGGTTGGTTQALTAGPLHLAHPSVAELLVAGVALTVVRLALQLLAAWRSATLTANVQRHMRSSTFDAYVDAEWSVQAAEREGGLQQLMTIEVERTCQAVLMLAAGVSAACSLLVLLIAAFVVSPAAALALIVLVGALFALLRPLSGLGRKWAASRSVEELDIAESMNELVRVTEEVRVHGVGSQEKARLRREIDQVARWIRKVTFINVGIIQIYQAVALLVLLLALLVVHELHTADLAGLGAIVLILLRSFAYSQQLQSSYHQLVTALPSLAEVRAKLVVYQRQPGASGTTPLGDIETVALRNVTYAYRPGGQPALSAVSFEVPRGEVVGVVGPSGAGKSSLVQILLRLRAPGEGDYLVNGRPAAGYDEADWARLVSYVPQEPKLLSGSVGDNIRFLRPQFSDAEVEAAARRTGLHDEIVALPSGYATHISQRADALSGGQKQRLCLARALIGSPQLLVLDEPTSALDAESERIVQETLASLASTCCLFIVAHRLSTLRDCTRILVLNAGTVEEFDTPARLAAQNGFYSRVAAMLAPSVPT